MKFPEVVAAVALATGAIQAAGAAEPQEVPFTTGLECARPKDWVETLVCKTPELLDADRKINESFNPLPNWVGGYLAKRPLACGGRAPSTPEEERSCVAALGRAMTEIAMDLVGRRSKETFAEYEDGLMRKVSFPEGWWGWSGPQGEIIGERDALYVGTDGAIYVKTTDGGPGISGRFAPTPRKPTRFAIINAFTGAEIASSRADPGALDDYATALMLNARLGLHMLVPRSPQVISTYQFQDFACAAPRKMLIGQSIYIYEWLPKPVTRDQKDGECSGEGPAARTTDYEGLTVEGYGPFKDGTIIAVANEMQPLLNQSWLIRFKPDMTSPFFAGRTDIVPVDQKTVFDTTYFTFKMDFKNHVYDPPDSMLEKVLVDMRAVLVEATRRQAAQRP